MRLPRTCWPFLSLFLFLLAGRLLGQDLVFDTPSAARELLGKRDPFIEHLSPFDRAARMKTNGPVDEATFLRFVADSVVEWKSAEQDRIRSAFDQIRDGLQIALIVQGITTTKSPEILDRIREAMGR